MAKKRTVISLAAIFLILGAIPGSAAPIEYIFEFTGADLLKNQFADGQDGSTAVDNELFDGARMLGDVTSYIASDRESFDDKWNYYIDNQYIFQAFWFSGTGEEDKWGENYNNPLSWTVIDMPADWRATNYPWWGTQLDYVPESSIKLGASNLDDSKFSFIVTFNDENIWQSDEYKNTPNGIDEDGLKLVVWFGAWLTQYNEEKVRTDAILYRGNMLLSGSQVSYAGGDFDIENPEPGTLTLLGLGLSGLAYYKRRRQNMV